MVATSTFTNTQNQHNLALIETHTFGSRVANEVNLSHNRFNNPQIEGDPAKQTAPNVFIDNQSAGCLSYQFGPFRRRPGRCFQSGSLGVAGQFDLDRGTARLENWW